MKSLLIIPGRFYRFSARKEFSAISSLDLSSFKSISSFQQIKPNHSPCGYSAAEHAIVFYLLVNTFNELKWEFNNKEKCCVEMIDMI